MAHRACRRVASIIIPVLPSNHRRSLQAGLRLSCTPTNQNSDGGFVLRLDETQMEPSFYSGVSHGAPFQPGQFLELRLAASDVQQAEVNAAL